MKKTMFKIARIKAGLTQQDLARLTSLSESQSTKIETGRLIPSHPIRTRLAGVLKQQATTLFGPDPKVESGQDNTNSKSKGKPHE